MESRKILGPIIDEVPFSSLYTPEEVEVETPDGWTLILTRFRPIPQNWQQPLLNVPLLLVHGFSQNRHAFTTGEFVKNMLYFGTDIFILELRGHGKSGIKLQLKKAREKGTSPPPDLDYQWDFSDYFLYDVPSAIETIKRVTGASKIAYCGHSMGGIIGYGLASQRQDLLCLATIGAPGDLGAEALWVRLLSYGEPLIPLVQKGISGWNRLGKELDSLRSSQGILRRLLPSFKPLNPHVVPMDLILGGLYRTLVTLHDEIPHRLPRGLRLFNPHRVRVEDIEWLLKVGEEREPINVLRTLARWVRKREIKCYRSGYDIKANLSRIRIPLTIIFGDEDFLAGIRSTRPVYRSAKSNYLVWRPVRGNSHIEITMGHDIRQICYDIKNLIEFSLTHENLLPRLPRHPEEVLLQGSSTGGS
jgi:pimeloyl-ACP methyl ester carboxylesterase